MTKKEQLLYLREQAKKSGDANLKKLIVIAAKSGSQSAENQKKIWSKVGSVVDKFKNAEKAAEKAQKASVAKKVASKPKKASKPVAKKAKPTPAPKPKKSSGRGPKSRGETFFGRAKMIREENPSLTWKEAQAEAKKFFADEKSRKAKAIQDAIKSFPDLKRATKDTTNIQKDAAQPAMPPGKRKSRPGAKRKFYWETRSNRSDIRQPSKKYPMLEQGGTLNTVLVKFDDPKYNYRTSVSAKTTEESARQYFIGMPVNVGAYPKEVFKRVVDIEFNPPGEKMQKGGFVSESEMQSAFRQKDLSKQMGMAVDEDGFPEDLEISGALRKMMREDERFADKVRNAIMQTANMDAGDASEASRIFRELGIDMDYDLGGEPSGMSLMKKGGRFQKGGRPKAGKFVVIARSSGGFESVMRGRDGEDLFFENRADAEAYAKKNRTMNRHAYVKEHTDFRLPFEKGGKVQKIEPTGKKAPGLILRTDDDEMWWMGTNPRPYGRISCQPLSGYYRAQNTQTFIDEWFYEGIDPQKAVDWQWKSPDSILIQEMRREKVTDFDYEMMPVKSRKFMSANDFATVRSGLLEMGVPKEFAEEATKVIMKGRNLKPIDFMEEGGKVSNSKKRFAQGGSVDADVKSILYDLKKGDRIVLDYTGGMASGQITLEFVSKRRVGKGKTWEKDKWTFKNPNNPKGVKYFAYASDGGVPRFALGNMAISPTAIRKQSK